MCFYGYLRRGAPNVRQDVYMMRFYGYLGSGATDVRQDGYYYVFL